MSDYKLKYEYSVTIKTNNIIPDEFRGLLADELKSLIQNILETEFEPSRLIKCNSKIIVFNAELECTLKRILERGEK